MLPITQMPSPNRYRGRLRPVAKIVIHDVEAAELPGTAEAVGGWFSRPEAKSSAHYTVDINSIVQHVPEADTAWHCPGSNSDGIGIEHAGYASQSPAQWRDTYSSTMLELSARLSADIALRHGIPARWLHDNEIRGGIAKGFHTHADATRAFGTKGGHTDPGPGFPRDWYMQRVAHYMGTDPGTGRLPAPSAVLAKGSTGSAVAALQRFALRAFPTYAGAIKASGGADGRFGDATTEWVKEFQRRVGLVPDGVVGPLTWAALTKEGMKL